MAQSQRNDLGLPPGPTAPRPAIAGSSPASDHSYLPGGQIGQMQADLAHRLAQGFVAAAIPASPEERFIRLLSVAGGYVGLLAGYVGIVLLMLR